MFRLILLAGKPAYIDVLQDSRTLVIRHVETRAVLAEVAIPVEQGIKVFPSDVIATSAGPAVIVAASVENTEGAEISTYWMVQFDRSGHAGKPMALPLPSGPSWRTQVIAVGDHVVALVEVITDELDTAKPIEDHVIILDAAGNVVRSRRDKDIAAMYPVGDTAFVAIALEADHNTARVFDLERLDWIGRAKRDEHNIVGAISLGGRAILVGYSPTDDGNSAGPVSVASLDNRGTLSAWKSLGFEAWQVALIPRTDPASAIVLAIQADTGRENAMRVAVVGPGLELEVSPHSVQPPAGGLGVGAIMLPDAIYLTAWGRVERLLCR